VLFQEPVMRKVFGYFFIVVAVVGMAVAGSDPAPQDSILASVGIGTLLMAGGGLIAYLCLREREVPHPLSELRQR